MSTRSLSHLAQAILRCLPQNGGLVSRQQLRARLAEDAWVARNQHRLARLDSTLAVLAGDGLLRLDGDQVAIKTLAAHTQSQGSPRKGISP